MTAKMTCMLLALVWCLSGVGTGFANGPLGYPNGPDDGKAESQATSNSEQKASPPADPSAGTVTKSAPAAKKKEKKEKRGSIVVAPLPISSPAIGSGIVPIFGYIFPFSKKDKVSPPSVIGGAGLITNNGSRALAIGGQLFLKEDTYQITAGFVKGNLNYNIYGNGMASGLKLPLKQTGQGFLGEVLRRVGWKVFVGPRFQTGHAVITVRPNNVYDFPIPPEAGLHTTLTAIGAEVTRDTRPNHFYPVSGTYFSFTSDFFSQGLGSKYSFQSYNTKFDKYWSLNKKQVIAYDANFCGTGGAPPFYGNCIYGTSNELRGYTAGRYFTRYSLATQVEFRQVLPKGFGAVVFGGLGGVIPGGNQVLQRVQSSHFLPAGGGGLRYMLSKEYHVNLSVDIAQGRDGHTLSIGVGEAF